MSKNKRVLIDIENEELIKGERQASAARIALYIKKIREDKSIGTLEIISVLTSLFDEESVKRFAEKYKNSSHDKLVSRIADIICESPYDRLCINRKEK